MNFELTPDQATLQAAIERVVSPYKNAPSGDVSYYLDGSELYGLLEEGGFLEAAMMEDYGALGACLLVDAASGVPWSVATAGAALVAPMALGMSLPGPVALARAGSVGLVRHLPMAKSLMIVGETDVRVADIRNIRIESSKSIFADPFGRATDAILESAEVIEHADPEAVRQWWAIAVAAEIGGAAEAALSRTVDYVKIRRQFGQPIGAYQALQHRLSECQVLVDATRVLTRRAAMSGEPAAAYLAAAYAETAAARVAYEAQQFHGAPGVTRENEIHFFTFRLRSLQGELGAMAPAALAASHLLWSREATGEERLPAGA